MSVDLVFIVLCITQIDHMASTSGLVLAGYYLANENIKDLRYVQLSECFCTPVR
jgi:hypothetical protein